MTTGTKEAAGTIYYVARKIKGKWHVAHKLAMPSASCFAMAAHMMHAALPGLGREHGWSLLTECQLTQRNILPFGQLPVIEYDARAYWTYRMTQCHPNSREMYAEAAALEGIVL